MNGSRVGTVIFVALRYLRDRRLASWVSVGAIGLAVLIVVGVALTNFAVKKAAVEGSLRYPLIVGPAGSSSAQLIFSTIFHVDKPTGTIPVAIYDKLLRDERVVAAYPLAVADSLESYPIVGTTSKMLVDLGAGAAAGKLDLSRPSSAVLGSEVAARTGLAVGDTFQGSHGMIGDEGSHQHAELAYQVVGVLQETGGPEDAAVYCPYATVWLMHKDQKHHQKEEHPGKEPDHDDHGPDRFQLGQGALTAVLVRTANPVYTAALERELTLEHGVQAVDTGRAIRRIVGYLNKGERLVELFGGVTLVIAAAMILVTLLMSLNERRRELALLRSLGVGRLTIAAVVMVEALLLTSAGALLGDLGGHVVVWWAAGPIRQLLGAAVEPWIWTSLEGLALGATLIAGQVLAAVSMIWTYRMNLVEEVARG